MALTRYLDDGGLPMDNDRVENWIQCVNLNGQASYTDLTDVLERLPSLKASQALERFPHNWQHTSWPLGSEYSNTNRLDICVTIHEMYTDLELTDAEDGQPELELLAARHFNLVF